jgi:signal transduction histidine kinase
VDIPRERFPPETEASAYFIVAEVLTNVIKHALPTRVAVRVCAEDGMLSVEVRDDGIEGVRSARRRNRGRPIRAAMAGGHAR